MWRGPGKRLSHTLYLSLPLLFFLSISAYHLPEHQTLKLSPFSPQFPICLTLCLTSVWSQLSAPHGSLSKTKLIKICLAQFHRLWMLVLALGCILVQIFACLVHFGADVSDRHRKKRKDNFSRLLMLAQHCRLSFSKKK